MYEGAVPTGGSNDRRERDECSALSQNMNVNVDCFQSSYFKPNRDP